MENKFRFEFSNPKFQNNIVQLQCPGLPALRMSCSHHLTNKNGSLVSKIFLTFQIITGRVKIFQTFLPCKNRNNLGRTFYGVNSKGLITLIAGV